MKDNHDDSGVAIIEAEQPSVWRYAMARRARLIIDGDDYFDAMREAMLGARQRIFLIFWDFDSRVLLPTGRRWWQSGRKERYPARLGSFILWLVRRNRRLDVRILKWRLSLFRSLFRGTMMFDLVRWFINKRIDFKFDASHPIGCSHHQKIVVIDDVFAACGGIDMTSSRWDTSEHLPKDPRRRKPTGRLYGPWHDVALLMEGDVSAALGDLGRERWEAAGGDPLDACKPQCESPWPEPIEAEFRNVEIGIARTRAAWGPYSQVTEVEELFLQQIRRAKRFIYAETQYFASRAIAEVICERLLEDDPPEIIIVSSLTAEGWLEQVAMDTARVQLVETLRQADHAGRLRIYTPFASDGTPIYVHSKLMIVDDEILRVGSANMNNRSMGLDSECDVFIDTSRPCNADVGPTITSLRIRLLAEHCGVREEVILRELERHGSMAAAVDSLVPVGKYLAILPLKHLSEAERALGASAWLDPERPGEIFEPIERRGLFRRKGQLIRIRLMQRLQRRSRG